MAEQRAVGAQVAGDRATEQARHHDCPDQARPGNREQRDERQFQHADQPEMSWRPADRPQRIHGRGGLQELRRDRRHQHEQREQRRHDPA
jgi:hypothetical protein